MSCGKPSEEIIGRSVEGNEEVLTVRKICHHNPAEDFETIQIYASDINEDGLINIQDIISLINIILQN